MVRGLPLLYSGTVDAVRLHLACEERQGYGKVGLCVMLRLRKGSLAVSDRLSGCALYVKSGKISELSFRPCSGSLAVTEVLQVLCAQPESSRTQMLSHTMTAWSRVHYIEAPSTRVMIPASLHTEKERQNCMANDYRTRTRFQIRVA